MSDGAQDGCVSVLVRRRVYSFTCKYTQHIKNRDNHTMLTDILDASFSGVASVAAFIVNGASTEPPVTAFSSFFQIGLAFALGIMFAIIIAGPTSGGHFNPAVTVALTVWYVPFPPMNKCSD